MSQQYPGGFITKANVDPTSSSPLSPAPGVWTLDQQLQYKQAGVWPSYAVNAIEDVFSTYLYTGTGATQTITNGIDLSGQGGLVWMKGRSGATDHALYDTARGATFDLASNTSAAQTTQSTGLTSFGSTGFSIGALAKINTNAATYASWTFRKQAKFFDVVTWTGDGIAGRTISHNLGSVPGCIIVKRRDNVGNWAVYHRANGANPEQNYLVLNDTLASQTLASVWNNTAPTSTNFTVGTSQIVNANTGTYVAYLFAHNAGGFGPNNTDNVISCGSFTGTANTRLNINLGYEPQWVLMKQTNGVGQWFLVDNMRGFPAVNVESSNDPVSKVLYPNLSNAEADYSVQLRSNGFSMPGGQFAGGETYIYIAIRRGPMRPPTTGTSVFGLNARTGTGANATVTGGQTDDTVFIKNRGASTLPLLVSRLTGANYLGTSSTAIEAAAGATILQANPWDVMDGIKVGTTSASTNASANTFINYLFRRAPGFFDVVCYTGVGAAATLNHNLSVAPEMVIIKGRSVISNWETYLSLLGGTAGNGLTLNSTSAKTGTPPVSSATATTFTLNNGVSTSNAQTYVAYLFATVAGVSKVGSYTGTAALQAINCGFTGGARFVLIKRTDSTGDWWTYDSARGITSGNDPYLFMNSDLAEVTGTNYVDTTSVGFQVTAAAPAGLNASGGTYIFLAIA